MRNTTYLSSSGLIDLCCKESANSTSIHDLLTSSQPDEMATSQSAGSFFRIANALMLIAGLFATATLYSQSLAPSARIDSIMVALHQRGQFNGAILVSVNGMPTYKSAFGNNYDRGKFETGTRCNIASLAKGFTAMIIMMLAEQRQLTYDDPIINYLPELKKFSNGITIRHLLTHTSGVPDVGDLGIDDDQLTNERALKSLSKLNSNFDEPGRKYQYSNTGYLLLASIAERITKEPFQMLVAERILKPLEMNNTVFVGKTVGMGEMESTIDDLFKWEESFYTEKLVRQSTLAQAFTPYQVREGNSTYGFGWNIDQSEGGQFVWHTGNASGYRALIGRRLSERIAVIILTAGDSKRMEINDAIINVIRNKSYALPKMAITDKLHHVVLTRGIAKAMSYYDSLKRVDFRNFDFGESQLNSLGYSLMGEKKLNEAIEIFRLNTVAFPESSNAWDSLGEAYYSIGDKATAIVCYEKALTLDSNNLSSKNMLKKLKK